MRQKTRRILLITGTVITTVLLIGAGMIFGLNLHNKGGGLPDVNYNRYATGYPLKAGETEKGVLNKWAIEKSDYQGTVSLRIWHSSKRNDALDYMTFHVYDSSSEAKKAYGNIYDEFSEYKSEEGDNWFCYWEPGVCDAEVERMYYIEDNVIITAEIGVISCWSGDYLDDGATPTTATTTSDDPYVTNRRLLKNYIIENAADIHEYLLHDVLGYA